MNNIQEGNRDNRIRKQKDMKWMKQNMSSNRGSKNDWGDVHMNQKLRIRIQSDKIYDEKETPNICHGILLRNSGRKFHICESNIPFCSEHDKPLCGDKNGKRGCRNSVNESLSNSVNKHGATLVHECVV